MFQKVFEYAGPHKKGLYAATAIVLVSVLLGVFPFVLAYQVIATAAHPPAVIAAMTAFAPAIAAFAAESGNTRSK